MKKYYRLYPLLMSLVSALFLFSCSNHDKGPVLPTIPPETDSLFSWRLLDSVGSLGTEDIWFVSPSRGFYAGGDNNLYQSQDSGKTWSLIPGTTFRTGILELFFVDDMHGFALAANQMEITGDGGNTWSLKQLPTTNAVNIFFTTPADGFCGDVSSGLFRTIDTGSSWTPVYEPTNSGFGYYTYFLNPATGFVMTGNGYFSLSTDSGKSWSAAPQITVPDIQNSYSLLQFLDNQTGFFAGANGLLKTTNGGQAWSTINSNGSNTNIVKFFNANTGYYATDSVIYKTANGGISWTTSCKVLNDAFSGMHFIDSTTGWACTFKGRILRIDQ